VDNDCDGVTDENAAELVDLCETGAFLYDGLDNNCDGRIDEPGGCMAHVQVGHIDVLIDRYENTVFEDADCTGIRYGMSEDYPVGWPPGNTQASVTLYACSLPGVRPSAYMTRYRAQRACAAQGKRLCTKEEWSAACGGDDLLAFTYGNDWQPDICNDASMGVDATVEAGSLPECISPTGAFDMSGNLWDLVDSNCQWNPTLVAMQGGSHNCSYCEGTDCVPCDPSIPEHLETIRSRYACHYPGVQDDHWCDNADSPSRYFGFRCCMDP
jgi:formylglycine-generating enzyme required for sulfatase activity